MISHRPVLSSLLAQPNLIRILGTILFYYGYLSAQAQQLDINVTTVQQRFCVPSNTKKAKASILVKVPAGNCDVEKMEIDWDDNQSSEKFNVNIPRSTKDTSFIREHEYDLTDCLYDRRFNILLTSTFKNCNGKQPGLAPGIVLFTNPPSVKVTPRPAPACVKQEVSLDLTFCPAKDIQYSIDYGDGTTGTTPKHTYDKVGNYTITVKASNVCNANNPTVTPTNVNIIDLPIPKIGADSGRVVAVRLDTAIICYDGGGIIRLDGIGSINATQYDWDISPAVEYLDKTTENSANPKIRFVKPGTYTISLRVNNACNVWSERVKCVHVVEDLPVLSLDIPNSVCTDTRYRPTPFNAKAKYTINGKPLPASGDTLLKVGPNPYVVLIEGKLDNICGGTPKSVSFTVGNAQDVHLVSPRRDTTLCAGSADLLLETDLTDGDWDTDTKIRRIGGKAFFMTTDTGSYTLRYRRGVGNCQRSVSVTIRVLGTTVRVDPATTCQGEVFLKLKGTPANGQWRTLANCPGCIQNDTLLVKNIPAGQTSLPVVYSVVGSSGCSASATTTVTIGQPQAVFTITNGCSGKTIKVTNQSIGATAFQWFINNSSTPISSDREPSLQLPAGQVQVTLVARAGSCSATVTRSVTITSEPSNLTFTPNTKSGCSPLPVTLLPSGTFQPGVSYSWNFGNGKTSTAFDPGIQTFENSGRQPLSFTITFQGSNACGSFTHSTPITVLPKSKAEIGIDSTTLRCPPATLTFSNRSTGFNTATWAFGDQSQPVSSTAGTVSHEYTAPVSIQTYLVKLTVSSGCGNDTDSTKITVFPVSTTALFTISKSEICPGDNVKFTDASTPKPIRISWEIDGQKLDGASVDYDKFIKPGTTYKIKQTVYPACGGYLTREQSIRTDTLPKGNFKLPPTACPGQPVSITNTSSSSLRFRWNFGDGSPIDSAYVSPTHTFQNGGATYTVWMTVVGFPIACTTAVSQSIQIRTKPKPDFSIANQGKACSDTLVTFVDKSQNATEWRWYANNELISQVQSPQVRLNKGQYDIKLWVSNRGICPDSLLRQDAILVDTCVLYVANAFSPNGDSRSDFFNVYGNNLQTVRSLRIFSRWGVQVYEGENLPPNTQTAGWDGLHNGIQLPPDNYVYEVIVEFIGGAIKQQRGVFTLLR